MTFGIQMRPQQYALRGSEGYLCFGWWAAAIQSVVIFTDPKLAKTWISKVNKRAQEMKLRDYGLLVAVPQLIHTFPEDLKFCINPSVEPTDIDRIMKRMVWRNW